MSKVLIKCDTCGKDFFKYSSKIGKNNFCCKECHIKVHQKYGWTSNIKMTPDFLKKPGQK